MEPTTVAPEALKGKELADYILAEFAKRADQRDNDILAKCVAKMQAEIEAKFAELEAKRAALPVVKGLSADDASKFSMSKLCAGLLSKNLSGCQYEVELCNEAAKTVGKDMSTTTDSAGGFVVPMQVMDNMMIPILAKKITALGLGVQRLPLSGSPVPIPRLTSDATAYWVAENSSVTASDLAFGQMNLTPHAVAGRVILSNRLINLSNPAAETITRESLARSLGIEIDRAIYLGVGGGQPTGICNTSGIGAVTSFGALTTGTGIYDKLLDVIQAVAVENVELDKCMWVLHTTAFTGLAKMVDPSATKQLERRLFGVGAFNGAKDLMGYMYHQSNNLTALSGSTATSNSILFGDFTKCYLGEWGTMVIRASDVAGDSFAKLQTMIVAAMEVDVGVAQPKAFCTTQGVSLI